MIHWIFIALFIVAFWHLLKLEKEIKTLKRKFTAQETYMTNLYIKVNAQKKK